MTDKPIFIFESLFDYIPPERHSQLRKRCYVIPSKIDSKSKLIYNEEKFEDYLINNFIIN